MPRFEVASRITYQFDAKDREEARYLVENGEMPRDHELIDARVVEVSRVVTEEELHVEQSEIERAIQVAKVKL